MTVIGYNAQSAFITPYAACAKIPVWYYAAAGTKLAAKNAVRLRIKKKRLSQNHLTGCLSKRPENDRVFPAIYWQSAGVCLPQTAQ